MWWSFLAACSPTGNGPSDDSPTDGEPPTVTDTDPPPVADTTDTGTVLTTGCGVHPDQSVISVDASQPWQENEAQIVVDLKIPATVAVACTLVSDPTEVHLVESADVSAAHTLRVPGLLAGELYTCAAAPLCPEMARAPTVVSLATEPAPIFFPSVTTTTYGDPVTGYALVNHTIDCDWAAQRLLVTDREGRVRWYHLTPPNVGPSVEFRYHGDDRFVWGGGWGPNPLGRPRELDVYDHEIYDSAAAMPDVDVSAFHHDGKQLPDGRYLTLEQVPVDLIAGGGSFDGFRVRRIDPVTNTVDFTYDSQRAYDEGHLPGGYGDVWHANWMDIVDDGVREVLYVSLCNLGWTVAIDVATGDWLWTFGAGGDFSLVNTLGQPISDFEFPQCEHGIEKTPTGLLMYDNGAFGRGFSRASEYSLDEVGMVATLEWVWSEPEWFETTLGDVDQLANGHVWIGAGHAECFSSNPGDHSTILEIDPVAHEKVWELQYDNVRAMAYRADHAEGCALFSNTSQCPALADRLAALAPIFDR
jgi:hypothetical protein